MRIPGKKFCWSDSFAAVATLLARRDPVQAAGPRVAQRLRRLVLTSVALLLAMAGTAALSPTPAHAGEAGINGRLIAAIYNDSMFPLVYVDGWSEYGFYKTPTPSPVPVEGRSQFEIQGSSVWKDWWPDWGGFKNSYNAWFTFKVTVPYHGGVTEYITMSIHGERAYSANQSFPDSQPTVDVFQTSVAPASSWRHTAGPPPHLIADPQFSTKKNTPYLFDLTVEWDGEGPGEGVPAIVGIGDSTISGEGGRWAGNTNGIDGRDDAGATWYWDAPTGESEPDCHRSKSALVHIGLILGAPYRSHNFACSAAMTSTYSWDYGVGVGWRFKPGVDFFCGGVMDLKCPALAGETNPRRVGQLNMLYHYARTHNVKHVVLAVGANDFDFSGLIKECFRTYDREKFVPTGKSCYDSDLWQQTLDKQETVKNDIFESIDDLIATMDAAGYDTSMYTIIVQNYWSPIPSDLDIRIPDDGFRRQLEGGCPILAGDASALNLDLLPAINNTVQRAIRLHRGTHLQAQIRFLDVSDALKGHRICEKGVGLIEDIPNFTGKGTSTQVVDKVEWVTQLRYVSALVGKYTVPEGGHANYWGQLALRNCLRQMIHQNYQGGKCVPTPGGGVNSVGEPKMTLTSRSW
jgi:hypothetical protein